DHGHDSMRPRLRQHHIGQTDSEELVRPNGAIALSTVDDIIETVGRLIPEQAVKTGVCTCSHGAIALLAGAIVICLVQGLHNAQGVVPQRLNFHGLAIAWGYHPVTDSGIHPGKLHARFSSCEQTVRVYFDAVTRPTHMPGDDVAEDVVEMRTNKRVILGSLPEGTHGFKEP